MDLDDTRKKKLMEPTRITINKNVINNESEELIKSDIRKRMLEYIDSGVWEGNLEEMRTMR